MNKKILVLLIFLAIASISTASAFELNDLFGTSSDNSTGETINVSGIDFKIPNGFEELVNQSVENESDDNPYTDFTITSKTFRNATGDAILISVSSSPTVAANDTFAKDASDGGNQTTINGVEGYTFISPGFDCFTFAKDGKLAIISVTDKQLLNDVVVA